MIMAGVERVKFDMDNTGKAGRKSNKRDEGLRNSLGKIVISESSRNRQGLIKLRNLQVV